MADTIRVKRGTTTQRLTYTPSIGEPLLDTSTNTVYIGDGTQVGGYKVGGQGDINDFTIYVCTTALGATSAATGRLLQTGTTTSTSANQLVNTNASFTSALVGKTVYNSTDATWAKITSFVSASTLGLSASIMAVSENYTICDAIDTLSGAYSKIDSPYLANVTILFSPGTFSADATLIGKSAGGNKTITVQGDNTAASGGTIFSGTITVYDTITFAGGSVYKLSFSKKIEARGTADITYSYCQTTGSGLLYVYDYAINDFANSTMTFGNDPGKYTSLTSTITIGYTLYVASQGSPALGGSDSAATGLQMSSGSATSTSASKLVDSAASFTSDMVGKTVYNSTDDTWARIGAVDSATQLSLDQDIMVSGESYVIANAFATVQKAIDAIPGSYNCNTTVRISNGTFTDVPAIRGKVPTGNFKITFVGTLTLLDSLTASSGVQGSGATQGTVVRNSGTWTANQRQNKLVTITSGTNNGLYRIIDSNDTTTLTIAGCWSAAVGTSTFRVYDWGTILDGSAANPGMKIESNQQNIILKHLKFSGEGGAYPVYTTLYLNVYAQVDAYACWFNSSALYGSYQEPFSNLFCYYCFYGDANSYGSWTQQSKATFWQSKFYNATAANGKIGPRSTQGSQVAISRGTIIDNWDSAAGGAYADQMANLVFYSAAADGNNIVRNCVLGIGAAKQSNIQNNNSATYVTYSGNTTDTSADASSTKDY